MTLSDIDEVINFLKENLIVVIARAMAQVGFHREHFLRMPLEQETEEMVTDLTPSQQSMDSENIDIGSFLFEISILQAI